MIAALTNGSDAGSLGTGPPARQTADNCPNTRRRERTGARLRRTQHVLSQLRPRDPLRTRAALVVSYIQTVPTCVSTTSTSDSETTPFGGPDRHG